MIGSVNIVLSGVSCQGASLTLVARMTSKCFLTGAGVNIGLLDLDKCPRSLTLPATTMISGPCTEGMTLNVS